MSHTNTETVSATSIQTMSIDALPDELLVLVLRHVPCIVRARDCALVCHRWRAIAADNKAIEPCINGWRLCLGKLGEAVGAWGDSLSSLTGADSLPRSSPVLLNAVSKGHVHCLAYARSKGHAWGPDACNKAARSGQLAALKWLVDAGCPHLVALYEGVMCTGHDLINGPDVHYYLHRRDIKPLMREAIKGGHVPCVDWLVSRGLRLDPAVCHLAAKRGHLDMLRYARAEGVQWDEIVVCDSAVRGGQLDVLTYVQADHLLLVKLPWYLAAGKGWTHLLEFAVAHGCEIGRSWMLYAIGNKDSAVRTARWLLDHGYTWHPGDMDKIMTTNTMDLLVFARTCGCPWNTDACEEAAHAGWLEALQYAHENGCPWDWHACMAAAMKRRVGRRCRRYLKEHPWCGSGGVCRLRDTS